MKTIKTIFLKLFLLCGVIVSGQTTVQIEDLNISGPYVGAIDSPFNGIGFYGNGDKAEGSINLSTLPGLYKVEIRGASSNDTEAKINLNIGDNVSSFSFSGASTSNSSREITIIGSSPLNFSLELITDNGSNDTFLDRITFTFLGSPPPPRQAPVIPAVPSFESGIYRNMFVESGKTETEVQQKMNAIWEHYFVNGDSNNERLYYEVGNDMAYILDTGNNDIRSEGMSYGMMICVQLGKKAQFDKLWRFAETYSQHPEGTDREGLFSWQLSRSNFSMIDQNSAPDGEEYFVTALFFADALWGSNGSIDYRAAANYILDSMLNKPAPSLGGCPTGLVDQNEKQIVFGICGNSASFTDPSYHLPAFYEIWAREADSNNQLWADMATVSRTYLLPRAAHPQTGLMPDYSEFDGRPVNQGNHGNFEFDAWRNIMNMGFDFAWFQKSKNDIQPLIDKQINFFKDKPGYSTLWTLDGSFSRNNDHSPGLVACNAVGALALEDAKVWPFVDEFFDTPIPSGQFRYYDGLLYMMSFMHLSGNFKAITDNVDTPDCNGTPFPAASVTVTNETVEGANDGKITFTFSDEPDRGAIEFSRDGGLTYPLNVNDNLGSATFDNVAPGIYDVWGRWGNNDCPISLGNVVIEQGDVVDPIQSPFVNHTIPGIIEAENYDNGGQGVAYNDSDSSNNGGQGRTDEGVDLQNTSDTGSGTNLGWTANGEWLEYTIGNVTPGTYDIVLRVASTQNNSKSLSLKLGTSELGSIAIPNTNGWQSWQNVRIENVEITSGNANQVLRLDISGGLFNINWIRFEESNGDTGGSTCDKIQAENNTDNFYQLNNANGIVTNISYSHWLKFDNVDISGGKFTFRYSKGNNQNGYMKLRIDNNEDSNNIAEIYPENTGGWNNYVEKTVNISGSGNHVVYLYFHDASRNIQLDWISFESDCEQRVFEEEDLLKEETENIQVFPNPSNGTVNIIMSEYNDTSKITLFDLSGRAVRSIDTIRQKNHTIHGLSKGVYLLKVYKTKKAIVKKLVIN